VIKSHFILYVSDQRASAAFYEAVLDVRPVLDVPGMTEFRLGDESVLGLMPVESASRLLGRPIGKTAEPRAEIYLIVDDPATYHKRALAAGAEEISPLSRRDWGHDAAYSLDPDGHVLAFAKETRN